MTVRFLCLLVLLCNPLVASAVNLAGSGEMLAMLQKIQGEWRTSCRPLKGGKVFEELKLSISYTEMQFTSIKYEGGFCNQVIDRRYDTYQYAIKGLLSSQSGKQGFAIDFKPQKEISGFRLHPLNIVYFEDGNLYFGKNTSVAPNQRLRKLELQRPFLR